jgi:hypothetical protein
MPSTLEIEFTPVCYEGDDDAYYVDSGVIPLKKLKEWYNVRGYDGYKYKAGYDTIVAKVTAVKGSKTKLRVVFKGDVLADFNDFQRESLIEAYTNPDPDYDQAPFSHNGKIYHVEGIDAKIISISKPSKVKAKATKLAAKTTEELLKEVQTLKLQLKECHEQLRQFF